MKWWADAEICGLLSVFFVLFVMFSAMAVKACAPTPVQAGPGAAAIAGHAATVGNHTIGSWDVRNVQRCTHGRTVKVPILEAYGWDGQKRDTAYEWIAICEQWGQR